jgi:rhodanese-related sulfurtransferase
MNGNLKTTEIRMKDVLELARLYYEMENAVMVSPHGLRKRMDAGDNSFQLVDLRSPAEFARSHIIGAVNVAAYTDPETAAYEETERMLAEFRALGDEKELILYCYSAACMTGRKIGKMLSQNDILAKHLNIGWNEWRYDWRAWNHEHEWESAQVESYIESSTPTDNVEDPLQCIC